MLVMSHLKKYQTIQAQTSLKKSSIIDRNTGRVDLRYNPLSIDEDYFIPVRGAESGTKIGEVAGQAVAGEGIQDVEYIQKKLFAALKVPKAYLGYEEGLGSKATLSQQDIRFARSIARIQRTVLAEMNKLAIIHLYCNGYSGEDLLDFNLQLSTPSTISQLQKLELIGKRFETAAAITQAAGLVDRMWIQKNILKLTDEELRAIEAGLIKDKKRDLTIEATQLDTPAEEAAAPEGDAGGGFEDFGDVEEPAAEEPAAEEPAGEDPLAELSINDDLTPIRVSQSIAKVTSSLLSEEDEEKELMDKLKEKRRKAQTKEKTATDQLYNASYTEKDKDITGMKRELSDLQQSWKSPRIDEEYSDIDAYLDNKMVHNAQITNQIKSVLNSLDDHINSQPRVISESQNTSGDDKNET
jgi:hypothetical protein